uniref:Uncharacterized protein n=1 Tax=Aegilops tauschii TaxID=37682 RepID=R7W0W6_AEGTA
MAIQFEVKQLDSVESDISGYLQASTIYSRFLTHNVYLAAGGHHPAMRSALQPRRQRRQCRPHCQPPAPHVPVPVFPYDVDPMQFALNLEYTEADFFLHAAFGVDYYYYVDENPLRWKQVGTLNPYDALHFGCRAIQNTVGLLGVEAGQDAVFRALLFERKHETVPPYKGITVAEFSATRNQLGKCGVKDKGLTVPPELGPEGKICTNVLSADRDSLLRPDTGRVAQDPLPHRQRAYRWWLLPGRSKRQDSTRVS